LNTYGDVLFYSLALLFWSKRVSPWFFVPLMLFAAANRETCMMILVFAFFPEPGHWRTARSRLVPITAAALAFLFMFLGTRAYYGPLPHHDHYVSTGWSMLDLNLASRYAPYMYLEALGTVSLLPLIMLLRWRDLRPVWKQLFVLVVPGWFGIHLWSVVCWESRLFLVPLVLVLLPAVLDLVASRRSS
jgi:hypothetical protein